VFAAFDTFEDVERAVGVQLQFIDALELVEDPETFAEHLHRGARTA